MFLSKAPALLALVVALLTGALPWRYCTGHGDDGGGGWRLGFAECHSAETGACSRHQLEAAHEGCGGSHKSSEGDAPHDESPCCCDSDLSITTGTAFEVVALDAPALCGILTVAPDIDLGRTSCSAVASCVQRPRDPGASSVVLLC